MPTLKMGESGRYSIKGIPSRAEGERLQEYFTSRGLQAPIFKADRPEELFRIVVIGQIANEDARRYAAELGIEFKE